MKNKSNKYMQLWKDLFRRNDEGTVAVTVALSIIPILMLIGFSLDFNRLQSAQFTTQTSIDASVLALAREFQRNPNLTDSELETYVKAIFDAEIAALNPDITCSSPSVTIDRRKSVFAVDTNCGLPTAMGGIIGIDSLSYSLASEALMDQSRLELALMLDVSGSMRGARILALQDAATDMIDTLIVPGSDRARIALAPYSTSINADSYFPAVTGLGAVGGTTTTGVGGIDFSACVGLPTTQEIVDCYNQVVDNILQNQTSTELQNAINLGLNFEQPTCVTERSGLFSKTDREPASGSFVRYDSNRCPVSAIVPLTANANKLKDQINALSPEGATAGHRMVLVSVGRTLEHGLAKPKRTGTIR